MQTIKNVMQLHDLSTRSGIAARLEQNTSAKTAVAPTGVATSSTSADIEKQRKRIHNLFLRLAAMYGHVWRSLYKSEEFLSFTKNEWLEGLKKFEDRILDSALQNCLQKQEYPPTLPQFIECCKAHSKQGQYEIPSTEIKRSNPQVARMHLNQMRTILNMPSRQEDK